MQKQTQKVIGINISDTAIKAAYLSNQKETIVTNFAQKIELQRGVVDQGIIQDSEYTISALNKLLTNIEPNDIKSANVVFGLPESQVYTYILEKSNSDDEKEDIEQYIKSQVELLVPESLKDIIWKYKLLESSKKDNDKKRFLLTVVKREAIKQYETIATNLEARNIFFDNTLLAISRLYINTDQKDRSIVIVNVEPNQTSVLIIHDNLPHTIYTVPVGVNHLIGRLMDTFNLTYKQAKEKVLQIDLSTGEENIDSVFKQEFQIILEDIENTLTILFRKQGLKVDEIIVIGEAAKVNGLTDYIQNHFGITTSSRTPDQLSSQKITTEYIKPVSVAVNLIKPDSEKNYPLFELDDLNSNKNTTETDSNDNDIQKLSRVTTKADIMVKKNEVDGNKIRKKLRLQKTILISILMIGLILVPWLIQSRNKAREERQQEVESLLVSFDKTQDITVTATIATNPDSYNPNYIRGSIILDSIPASGTLYEATLKSRRQAEAAASEGQILWKEPLSIDSNEGSAPFDFSWLTYLQDDQKRIFVKEVDKINSNNISYSVNSFTITEVNPTENPDLYITIGVVNVSLSDLIPIPENTSDNEKEG